MHENLRLCHVANNHFIADVFPPLVSATPSIHLCKYNSEPTCRTRALLRNMWWLPLMAEILNSRVACQLLCGAQVSSSCSAIKLGRVTKIQSMRRFIHKHCAESQSIRHDWQIGKHYWSLFCKYGYFEHLIEPFRACTMPALCTPICILV